MTGIHPVTRQRARKLRAGMTPQERKVWAKLRELNRMLGLHFRRQAPIGPFIADFADLGRRVVIEIDGGGHGGERDIRRDEWLSAQGFQVLRFWNPEVSGNIEGVMQVIFDAVGDDESAEGVPPHPIPPPQWGEGGAERSPLRGTADRGASSPPGGEGLGVGGSPSATGAPGGHP